MEDLRCTVQSLLQSQLEDSNGFLHRESWIRFLRDIGGTEQEAQAVLQEIPEAQISFKQFLDILFCPKDTVSAEVLTGQESDSTTTTNNLREYFEKHYHEGGFFVILIIHVHTMMIINSGRGFKSQLRSRYGVMPLT
jgi:hypothetical protein